MIKAGPFMGYKYGITIRIEFWLVLKKESLDVNGISTTNLAQTHLLVTGNWF